MGTQTLQGRGVHPASWWAGSSTRLRLQHQQFARPPHTPLQHTPQPATVPALQSSDPTGRGPATNKGQACDHGSQLLPSALAPWLNPRGHPECPHSVTFLPPSLSLLNPQPPVCAQMSLLLLLHPSPTPTSAQFPVTCRPGKGGCGLEMHCAAMLPLVVGISLAGRPCVASLCWEEAWFPRQRGLSRGQEMGFGFSPGLCWLCSLGR